MLDMMVGSALVLGLATSLHCAGMCGPLACSLVVSTKPQWVWLVPSIYHVTRLMSYAILGGIAGGLSQTISALWQASPLKWLPWVVVLALLCHALGVDSKIPKPKFLQRIWFRQKIKHRNHELVKAGMVGLMTPLLPCGPLYLFLGVCLASGSMVKGASLALAFGLGTVPLLWLAQSQWMWLQKKIGPVKMLNLRRGLTFAMALFLMWRLQMVHPFQDKPIEPFCPMCEGYTGGENS